MQVTFQVKNIALKETGEETACRSAYTVIVDELSWLQNINGVV